MRTCVEASLGSGGAGTGLRAGRISRCTGDAGIASRFLSEAEKKMMEAFQAKNRGLEELLRPVRAPIAGGNPYSLAASNGLYPEQPPQCERLVSASSRGTSRLPRLLIPQLLPQRHAVCGPQFLL